MMRLHCPFQFVGYLASPATAPPLKIIAAVMNAAVTASELRFNMRNLPFVIVSAGRRTAIYQATAERAPGGGYHTAQRKWGSLPGKPSVLITFGITYGSFPA